MAEQLALSELRFPPDIAEALKKALEPLDVTVADDPKSDKDTRPNPSSPFIMFINGKSGGRLGPDLLKISTELLTPVQVFDLQTSKPHKVVPTILDSLDQLAESGNESARVVRTNLKIFVAGGDGTVGWLLSVVESVAQPPPIAVIPLGTGNDLSRSFGWGPTFTGATKQLVENRLFEGAVGIPTNLDSWALKVTPSSDVDSSQLAEDFPPAMQESKTTGEDGKELTFFQGNFYNYFSIGMDAQVAYAFHHLRNTRPGVARGPTANKMIYATFGCTQGWFCATCAPGQHARALPKVATVQIQKEPDGPFVDLPLEARLHAVMILNLQSYAGGRNPWGVPKPDVEEKNGWTPARPDDAKLEILALTDGWDSLFMLSKIKRGIRLAQAYGVRIELRGEHRGHAFLQLDGEPWEQKLSQDSRQPTVVEITRKPRPALMLAKKGAKVLKLGTQSVVTDPAVAAEAGTVAGAGSVNGGAAGDASSADGAPGAEDTAGRATAVTPTVEDADAPRPLDIVSTPEPTSDPPPPPAPDTAP